MKTPSFEEVRTACIYMVKDLKSIKCAYKSFESLNASMLGFKKDIKSGILPKSEERYTCYKIINQWFNKAYMRSNKIPEPKWIYDLPVEWNMNDMYDWIQYCPGWYDYISKYCGKRDKNLWSHVHFKKDEDGLYPLSTMYFTV